jgi:CRP/FNR family transcriptional regulator, anaerobic regulatory protein
MERSAESAVTGSPSRAANTRFRQVACSGCAMQPICDPVGAPAGLPHAVEKKRKLSAGETLYEAGSPHYAVYAIHAGFLKSTVPGPMGERHIVRFLLPGDAAGLDGFRGGHHATDAVALDDCEICEIPVERAELLSRLCTPIAPHLCNLLATELAQSYAHAATLAKLSAHQRVASFFTELAQRWHERGYSPHAFRLPMRRRDLGEHLGLTLETVSRVLTEFRNRGWLAVRGREIEIHDAPALRNCTL